LTLDMDGAELPNELMQTISVLVPVAAIVVVAVLLLTVWTTEIAIGLTPYEAVQVTSPEPLIVKVNVAELTDCKPPKSQ
jgi:hypothetical protein